MGAQISTVNFTRRKIDGMARSLISAWLGDQREFSNQSNRLRVVVLDDDVPLDEAASPRDGRSGLGGLSGLGGG